ncbi:uncharacterized protein A4U43_C06F8130 [Asparagus officinalis]|uniref:Uncharacterized protein n=1 Tax=Asparagus officinalis TaxID=4686 RepID=A0A5P1EMQ4_ASPOF|nr:uncharacterized protein A4U43_C06F8130 [Asparagus officinalis]
MVSPRAVGADRRLRGSLSAELDGAARRLEERERVWVLGSTARREERALGVGGESGEREGSGVGIESGDLNRGHEMSSVKRSLFEWGFLSRSPTSDGSWRIRTELNVRVIAHP